MDDLKKEFDFFLNLFLKDNLQYYDVCLGGKRLRPVIVFEIASLINPYWRICTNTAFKIKRYALILELIHCTSLIIDDLPSMDNDTYRRGDLTFHVKHGQHSSYIMVYNLLTLIKKIIIEDDDKSLLYLELEELINYELTNLVAGQKYDLDQDWVPESGSRTLKIAELKTASLFKLATIGPFYILNQGSDMENENENENENEKKNLKIKLLQLGHNIGMAFQLSDDFLDIDIDIPTNNYGLETSKNELKNKYNEYHNSIKIILNDINSKKDSSIYEILKLMNNRFNE